MNKFVLRPDGSVIVNGAVIEGAFDVVVSDLQNPNGTCIHLSFMAQAVDIQKGDAPEDNPPPIENFSAGEDDE